VLVGRRFRVLLKRRGITDQILCFHLSLQLVEAGADLRIPVLQQEKLVVVGVVLAVERLTRNLAGPELPDKETAALVCGLTLALPYIMAALAAERVLQQQIQGISLHQMAEPDFVAQLQVNALFMLVGVVEQPPVVVTPLVLDKAALEGVGQVKTVILRLVV
jgi:hypothetical protein